MKRNNNRYENNYQINTNKSNNVFNPNINKSYKDFDMSLSSISNSIEGKFNTINNIRDSKVVKIKTITKKNAKPNNIIKQNINKNINKKEKEKDFSDDSSSDYANAEDDDFNNILRESINMSMSMKSLNTFKKEENPFNKQKNIEKLTYDKLNEHFKNNEEYIKKFQSKKETREENDNKAFDNLLFMNPYTDTNKSLNMEKINIPEKNEININNTPILNEEYNLLKNRNIFNNNNIIYLPKENKEEKDILENSELKGSLINYNKYISKKLKEMKFLERLKSISDSRYLFFIKNYRKENKFLDEDSFENILINEKNLQIQSPLTLIFLKIFNPNEIFGEKNFFQKNFSNYLADYDEYELQKVPRFFNDLSYVNNLFNTFNFEELNNFLEEINQWKNIYNYEQEYTRQIKYKYFKQKKYMTLRNNLTIYFISPFDLIIESHSKGTGVPFSDAVMAINQFIFHCDIKFDSKKGKFIFKTNVKVLNSIKMLKNSVINDTIKEEGKNENDEEIINNIWFPMKKEIIEQDLINQKNEKKIYEEYLKKNLNKYKNNIPEVYNSDNDSDDDWDSFSEKNNENKYDNYDENNNLNMNINDLNERNIKLLKYGGIFIIGIYLIKIFFSSFGIDTIFGIFWISLIGYLLYKFK